jgi:hypothetical protein
VVPASAQARVFAELPPTVVELGSGVGPTCSCERDLVGPLRAAGFARLDVEPYRLHSPFIPFDTRITGVAHV